MGSERYYTAKTRRPTPQPELFSLFEEGPSGARPGSVTDPAAQVRVARHTVEHRIEVCAVVQILDAPVPQMGNQLVEAFWHLDLPIPEEAIEVPQDLFFIPSFLPAPGSFGAADGGTVGGSAYHRIFIHCAGLWSRT